MPFSPEANVLFHQGSEGSLSKETPKDALRVLILEDNLAVKALLEAYAGFLPSVDVVSTDVKEEGIEAMQQAIAEDNPFDYIITDLGLKKRGEAPGVKDEDPQGGYEVAAFIKEHLPNARVTLFTGDADAIRGGKSDAELADMLEEKGIHDLLGKPLARATFNDAIEKARQHKVKIQQSQVQE